jgi:hypothetical protein
LNLSRQAEQQLEDVKDKLAAYEYAQSTTIDTKALEDAEYKARHEADALKHQLDMWAKDYAGENGRPTVKALVEKLNEQNRAIERLKMTLEVLEPVSIYLINVFMLKTFLIRLASRVKLLSLHKLIKTD